MNTKLMHKNIPASEYVRKATVGQSRAGLWEIWTINDAILTPTYHPDIFSLSTTGDNTVSLMLTTARSKEAYRSLQHALDCAWNDHKDQN